MMRNITTAFRNKYPAVIIAIVLMLSSVEANAQLRGGLFYNPIAPPYSWRYGWFKDGLSIPIKIPTTGIDTGSVYYRLSDSSVVVWTGSQWKVAGGGAGGGGSVSSVFGRTGTVTAQAGDYSAFYPSLSGTYNDPSWLNQLAWSKITGAPAFITNIPTDSSVSISNRINAKQDALVSGTNIKTVNGNSLLGSGDLTISGGGGSADSSWVSTETGTQQSVLGSLINTNFAGSSLPSGWADVTPAATVTVSDKLTISGGNLNKAGLGGTTGERFDNRITIGSYNYDKLIVRAKFEATTKNSSSRFGIAFVPNAQFFADGSFIEVNLTDNADSGGTVNYWSSIARTTLYGRSDKLSFSAGDSLRLLIIRDGWELTFVLSNQTTGKKVELVYKNSSPWGTGGEWYIAALGGTQVFTNFSIESFNRKNYGFTFIGESDVTGAGATSEFNSFANIAFRGNKSKYSNISSGSVRLDFTASGVNIGLKTTHVPNVIALNNPYAIIMSGRNDRRDLVSDTNTFRQNYDSVIQPMRRAGITVILTTLIQQSGSSDLFNTVIRNLGASYNLRVVKIDSVLQTSPVNTNIRPNYLSNDGIHLSDSGHIVVANELIRMIPEINELFADTASFNKQYNLPVGNDGMSNVVVDSKGELFQVPAKKFDGIVNVYNRNGVGTLAQSNSEIHISGPIKTDSALFIHNRNGLLLGFNGGATNSAGNTGLNIQIENIGVNGTGYPQRFSNVTGGRNTLFRPMLNKAAGTLSITGNDNWLIFNQDAGSNVSGSRNWVWSGNSNLTSGSDNILFNGRGISTGSNNIVISGTNTTGVSLPSNLSNAIIIGDLSSSNAGSPFTTQDISFSTSSVATFNAFWFGGRVGNQSSGIYMSAAGRSGTNQAGFTWYFHTPASTGNGAAGKIVFASIAPGASGSTLNSATTQEMVIDNRKITVDNRFQTSTGANVASANDLTLGNDGNVFTITGTTQINAITTTNWQAGSEIILIFSDNVTVKNNTSGGANTAVMILAGGADFSATANDVLKLVYNGTSWFEVSRSIN